VLAFSQFHYKIKNNAVTNLISMNDFLQRIFLISIPQFGCEPMNFWSTTSSRPAQQEIILFITHRQLFKNANCSSAYNGASLKKRIFSMLYFLNQHLFPDKASVATVYPDFLGLRSTIFICGACPE